MVHGVVNDAARPSEIEDPTNSLFVHRISMALLPLAVRKGVHPNTVSLAGLIFGALAGLCFYCWGSPLVATIGFLAMLAWHICDGLDGKLARATGKTSALGRFLDGICDHATFAFVYVALAASWSAEVGAAFAFGLAAAAGVAHAIQAAYYEGERASYIRRVNERFIAGRPHAAGGVFERFYNWAQARLSDRARPIDGKLMAAAPESRTALLRRYREEAAPVLKRLSLLGANSRTLAIWICCLTAGPALFWLWELVGLTLIGLWLGRRLRAAEARAG